MPIPRSMQDILDHADDLAKRSRTTTELMTSTTSPRTCSDLPRPPEQGAAPRSPRNSAPLKRVGVTWKRIGNQLGISAQAAQQRYGPITIPT